MIHLNINIRNPYWYNRFKNIKYWAFSTPLKWKQFEVQIMKSAQLFEIAFDITTKQDHAGFSIELALLGYQIDFTFYDVRHWNYEESRWMIYTEEGSH